jgi:pyruvate/2-oxoglutarate dehydrogenase complex dihydrolipoamide dehydrogenase (E3) component
MQQLNSANGSGEPLSISKPTKTIEADLCVIGAGSGGLSVAVAAAAFGVKVVLIEKHKMGGDCLNYGCVPSKAMIAAGRHAHTMRTSEAFGIRAVEPHVDFAAVNDHVKSVIAAIEPNDSVERFTGLGVQVIQAAGTFIDKSSVSADDNLIKARRYIIATGSSPLVPPIPGLSETPHFTNETLFDNRRKIDHLIIVGGGPIGMEMAQAHRRLGSKVTILEGVKAMAKDDPELASVVLDAVRREGVVIREGATVESVAGTAGDISVTVKTIAGQETVKGTHLLVAVGRKPNLEGLGLEQAGIVSERGGIKVDSGMVTSNRKVFAIGDCTGGLQFTHVANYHAGIVIRRALFQMFWAKANNDLIPWVTYTQPELASIGMSEQAARAKHSKVNVLRWPYHENDRAQAERTTEGLVKVIVDKKGRILGASIVGEHAGEIIQMWSLAISQKMNIRAMVGWISPYPTLSELNKRVAYRQYATAAGNPFVRKVLSWLRAFG